MDLAHVAGLLLGCKICVSWGANHQWSHHGVCTRFLQTLFLHRFGSKECKEKVIISNSVSGGTFDKDKGGFCIQLKRQSSVMFSSLGITKNGMPRWKNLPGFIPKMIKGLYKSYPVQKMLVRYLLISGWHGSWSVIPHRLLIIAPS